MSGENKSPVLEKKWDPALYDQQHSFVWKYGAEMLELLRPQPGERILDIGCGTGHLTQQIALSGAEVIGLDHSAEMIEKARTAYPGLQLVQADAADFSSSQPFDAVFSNAAMHWMKRISEVTACIARALKPGGRYVVEFGGRGNLDAVHGALKRAMQEVGCPAGDELKLYFPAIGEYASLLEEHGLEVTQAWLFVRPTALEEGENGLRRWLEMFTSQSLARLSPQQKDDCIRRVEAALRATLFRDGTWYADYRRIRIVAKRVK